MGGRRLEQTALATTKTPISEQSGTNSGTLNDEDTPTDPDLALWIECCPKKLHPAVREHIMAILRGTPDKEHSS